MPTNKNAYLRYKVIDNCLTNSQRKYSFKELLEKVNEALIEDDPDSSGIEVRQLRNDLKALKSSPFNAPIECVQEGKFYYYTYSEPQFSINKVPLNESETTQLHQTLQMLERFIGNENFAWLSEITPMLRDRLGMKEEHRRLISLETDEYNKGKEFVSPIFHAASNKRVLLVKYESFDGLRIEFLFHPYHLKRSNNRWFALGRNESQDHDQWVVPLDRIASITETDEKYMESEYDWDEHFQDFIGVTKEDSLPEEILLHFPRKQGNYVQTKPIHGDQIAKWISEDILEVKMTLILNFELERKLLSFGENVKIVKPERLKKSIAEKLKAASEQYL